MILTDLDRKLYIFKCSEIRNEIIKLEDEADIVAPIGYQLLCAAGGDVISIDNHLAGGCGVHPAQNVERGCLAGTGGAENDRKFSLFDLKSRAVKCEYRRFACAVFFGNGTEFNVRHRHLHFLLLFIFYHIGRGRDIISGVDRYPVPIKFL